MFFFCFLVDLIALEDLEGVFSTQHLSDANDKLIDVSEIVSVFKFVL